ncbi:hypothetical protein, partial [Xenorhabdus bovienii]|uniref:hypothetical protein n=1 Tax=Xenorhabdus bovienii TaxID=40576 RepID=UPI003DA6562A
IHYRFWTSRKLIIKNKIEKDITKHIKICILKTTFNLLIVKKIISFLGVYCVESIPIVDMAK